MATCVAVGVDNGGTWIRLIGLDARGLRIWSLKKPSPTVAHLPAFLHRHLKRFHGGLTALGVGSRGVWKPAKRREVKRALVGLAKTIVVMSDVEAAWWAAFSPHPRSAHPLPQGRGHKAVDLLPLGEGGRRPDEGIIVISGTGSIAYGRRADGTFARAGGLGPEIGDEGSGYWIGKKWLQEKKKKSVRQTAQLAPRVMRRSIAGDARARAIIQQAQTHLVDLVVELKRKLRLRGPIPLSLNGSVLENKSFRSGFFKCLRNRGIAFRFVPKRIDPAVAALSRV